MILVDYPRTPVRCDRDHVYLIGGYGDFIKLLLLTFHLSKLNVELITQMDPSKPIDTDQICTTARHFLNFSPVQAFKYLLFL